MNDIVFLVCLFVIIVLALIFFIIEWKRSNKIEKLFFARNEEKEVLQIVSLKQLIKQQNVSFALYVVLLATSFIFGVLLISDIFFYKELSDDIIPTIAKLGGLTGGGGMSYGAYRLYIKATKSIEKYLLE